MSDILLISHDSSCAGGVSEALRQRGFGCAAFSGIEEALARIEAQRPDLVLAELNGSYRLEELHEKTGSSRVPVIALVEPPMLRGLDTSLVSDFAVKPLDMDELVLRVKRLLRGAGGETVACGDLVVDLAKCEVTLDGTPVMLTFKEYELLKFLAGHRGRVFTRNVLLDKVWGYDYYGGDRTVDVHIRRLRSKIEDSRHTFIDTVRNIGYRFRSDTNGAGTS